VELRKHSRGDQSEMEELKQIVRAGKWLVYRRVVFAREGIRMILRRGFRRQRLGIVIADLRLLRCQQSERHVPAMIFARSGTAPGSTGTEIGSTLAYKGRHLGSESW
jgi:hypothetical protein